MDTIKSGLSDICRYMIPLIVKGLLASLKLWYVIFGVPFIVNIFAILVTYLKGEEIKITVFFIPNIVWGLVITLSVLFVYKSASLVALKLHELQSLKDKFTDNDLRISIVHFPSDYIVSYGIRIKNFKPFNLENSLIKILKYEVGKKDCTPYLLFPKPLPWLEDRGFNWAPTIIPSGEEKTVGLFGINEYEGKMSLYFPGPDGQPSEIKSMGDVESGAGVLFADFEIISMLEEHEITKPIRVRAIIDDHDSRVEIVKEKI